MNVEKFHALMDIHADLCGYQPWISTGRGYALYHRAAKGLTVVVLDYDHGCTLSDTPCWVATVWRTLHAFESEDEGGRLARLYIHAPAPIDLVEVDDEDVATVALLRAATRCLRLAPHISDAVTGEKT